MMWHAMRNAGWNVGRDQVARLVQIAGLQGVRRGRKPATTRPAAGADLRPDLVEQKFVAERPHELWVADIPYVRMLTGFCYVAFIIDVFSRRTVGWSVAPTLHTQSLLLLALEHALLSTGASKNERALTHHSDRGSQYVSLACSDVLITAGVKASVGTGGDSYGNALAETVNSLYKTELVYSKRIWASVSEVELATMGWVHWPNTGRLHEALGYRPPPRGRRSVLCSPHCAWKAMPVGIAEQLVADCYQQIAITEHAYRLLAQRVEAAFDQRLAERSQAVDDLTTTKHRFEAEADKLLETHFADAIDLPALKRHQDRIHIVLADVTKRLDAERHDHEGPADTSPPPYGC